VAFNKHPASLLDSPACTPISNKASLTSSILNGLMIAVINFKFFLGWITNNFSCQIPGDLFQPAIDGVLKIMKKFNYTVS
jgi:hypothetical protein